MAARKRVVIDQARPVRVFKNWAYGCYNIMQDGIVRATAREVRLREVEFRVRAAARARMLREQRRNVHAYAVGLLVDHVHPQDARSLGDLAGRGAFYDPYRFGYFADRETCAPLWLAGLVQFDARGITYAGPSPNPAAIRRAA